ncbi:MAG: TonB-dependent receptor [Bacteroidetes bacterium]|nr:TonB-dependent receptor [Bacteroidota bacterium]
MKKIYILFIALFATCFVAQAQSGFGEIRGKVIDEKTKKPMDFVTVTAYLNGIAKASTQTDDEGGYTFKTLQVGEYSLKAYISGYPLQTVTDIDVNPDGITFVNITMEQNVNLKEVVIKDKPALIRKDGVSGAQFNAAKIMALPQRNVNAVAGLTAGVETRAGATPNIRGGRSENTAYYIDGIRVQGGSSTGIASNAIDQIQVITGGTPAQYGDFIGGAISITTKAPTKRFIHSLEYQTSSPFTGYLDNSQFNQLEGVLSGPLKTINKGKGDKERVLIGFLISTNINYQRDGRLPATDIYKVNDTKLKELEARPLTLASNGSVVYSSEFLRKTDLQKVDYRQNVPQYAINLQGNFNFQPAENINIRLGYQGNYFNGRDYSYFNSLMNSSTNPLRNDYTVRAYLQFTQTFNKKKAEDEKEKKEVKGGISDAFYTIRVSYENRFVEIMDERHQKNFFDYGYIGQFKTYKAPAFERVSKAFGQPADTFKVNGKDYYLTSYWKQNSFRDTAYRFVPGAANPTLANYTNTVYALLGNNSIRTVDDLLGSRGLTNGSQPDGIYSFMWGNVGANQASYQKLNNETYAVLDCHETVSE